MKRVKRRHFLVGSLAASAAVSTVKKPLGLQTKDPHAGMGKSPGFRPRSISPNSKVVLGMMGMGGRMRQLLKQLSSRPDVEIACLCDVDESKFERHLDILDDAGRDEPDMCGDFRRMLDRKDIDAIVVATPLQWQALATIMSCQAGKDVYVEKPGSHNAYETELMTRAARQYDRVVQVGYQNRSATYVQNAIDYMRSGKLGKTHLVQVNELIRGGTETTKGPVEKCPDYLDWDSWCGPAPKAEYSPGRWWFDHFDYTGGRILDDGVHQLDVARGLFGKDYPKSVTCSGGRYHFNDGNDTPDTMAATFEYDDMTLVIQGTLWANYMYKTPSPIRDGNKFPDWRFNATKVKVLGTEAMMSFGRQGGGWQVHDLDRNMIASEYGRQTTSHHLENFIHCIETRERPNADVKEAGRSALLWHLANASFRAGGKKLVYDHENVEFVGDPEASKFLRRQEYRKPWTMPEKI